MPWDLTLGIMIVSVAIVNLSLLAYIEPMRKRLNTLFMNAKGKVEGEHNGSRGFYYVYEVRSKWEHYLLMLPILGIGDIFAVLGVYGYAANPVDGGAALWTVFVGGLAFSLVGSLIAYRHYLVRSVQVLAASEGGLEVWHVLGSETRCIEQISWSDIEDVGLFGNNYVGPIFIPWIFPERFPRYFLIVVTAGSCKVEVEAVWPNVMRLLEDAMRLNRDSKKWIQWDWMRKEVEKWKNEMAGAS